MPRPEPEPNRGRRKKRRMSKKQLEARKKASSVKTNIAEAGLTPREYLAVNAYFDPEVNFNKTEACRRARYASPKSEAVRVFGRPAVVAEIERRHAELAVKINVGQSDIIRELMKMAFFNIADYGMVNEDGTFSFNLNELSRDQLGAITGIKYDKEGRMVLETAKLEALEKLARHLGLFNDKLNVNVSTDLAQQIIAAKNRMKSINNDGG